MAQTYNLDQMIITSTATNFEKKKILKMNLL